MGVDRAQQDRKNLELRPRRRGGGEADAGRVPTHPPIPTPPK
jgi:hypothetical protein